MSTLETMELIEREYAEDRAYLNLMPNEFALRVVRELLDGGK
mgnify:CR=1 FL=1